ncbi:hypothetical protein DP114_11860 [Brasilonema sennae CENA114]|uniref:Filamentous haemagglutinin FhaB/tRNA nuclease CdiA-like TPS domain-containing protein n=1 Tax=Brasilonema sennae CENA114 TaxID=415709 RepID=A0A856MEE7_9CYAN|nr:filamentous hemagglutinin N-terminal domain-containing protein [Brasilonema sennae]QDL08499.1 hypothetical protein DP114_11860 [Brasilonema sennae CENA114]
MMKQGWHSLILFTLPLCAIGSLTFLDTATAQQVTQQVTPDGTVSTTVTTPDGRNFTINDGTRREGNLFHSFKEFSVPTGGSANFNNAADVQNIIGRVTGGSVSNIDGLIRTVGKANLFLLNPAGIIFGPNASLNIGGSFFGTTANSFLFDNNFEFSATNPQAPPLLTINVPIGLGFRNNPQPIRVQGSGQSEGTDGATRSFSNPTLAVNPGKTLALVGGNVSLEGGVLNASGGQVLLGGLAAEGTVGLNFTDNNFNFPTNVARADVFLGKGNGIDDLGAGINVITNDQTGGSITINARNIDISNESLLTAGIAANSGTVNTIAGDIRLNATGDIKINQSRIENNVNQGSRALRSGNIDITASTLSLTEGAQLSGSTYGQGNGGNITISASDTVSFSGVNPINGNPTAAFSNVNAGGIGNGGEINITAGSLELTNGGQLNAFVRGASGTTAGGNGNAGNVKLNIRNGITIAGVSNEGLRSSINSDVESGAQGNGGNIELQARSVSVTDGAQLSASTSGQGNGGNITINASDTVSLAGDGTLVISDVNKVDTEQLKRQGGDIIITTGTLSVTDGAQLSASTYGLGDAGNIRINASDTVSFSGVNPINGNPTAAFSNVNAGGVGNGGEINITAGSLELTNGGQLNAFVRAASGTTAGGNGNAGNVKLDIRNGITIAGVSNRRDVNGNFQRSSINSNVESGAQGKGGNIELQARTVSVADGGLLSG